MSDAATELARWAHRFEPDDDDLALADRALADTLAVALAAREEPLVKVVHTLSAAGRWAALAHVLDFDDLHMASTAHISVVCVPAVLASRGGARSYLAGAGVMARLGTALGWEHYASGWHATCTTGAPAAAVAAALSLGLTESQTAIAIALAIPAAGGTQRAFGSDAKSLQVGYAVEAGIRAARLAAAGATADLAALDDWMRLVSPQPSAVSCTGPAVPGGLAIKIFPCCYALQRPIAAVQQLRDGTWRAEDIANLRVTTRESTVAPLIHHRPVTGLQAKFSLEYAVIAAALDDHPGFTSFATSAVLRPIARDLVERVEIVTLPGGRGLLDDECVIDLQLQSGSSRTATLLLPPGAPGRPPTSAELARKIGDCGDYASRGVGSNLTWADAADLLATEFGSGAPERAPAADVNLALAMEESRR